MSFSNLVARGVALVGAATLNVRKITHGTPSPAWGDAPAIPPARPQGKLFTLKMPTAKGWDPGQTPHAAPGLKVNAFAERPRPPPLDLRPAQRRRARRRGHQRPARDHARHVRLRHDRHHAPRRAPSASAPTASPCSATATGTASPRPEPCSSTSLNQPFGMALVGDTFYVGNTDGVVAFPYRPGADRITAPGRQDRHLQARRPLDPQPAGQPRPHQALRRRRLAQQHRRRAAWTPSRAGPPSTSSTSPPARAASSPAACATRSASPWSRRPASLWTVVNERDGLGDETPPDYLTSVRDGGFYGWPYCYWGQTVDDRVPQDAGPRRQRVHARITPSAATPPRSACCWLPAGTLPGFPDGMVDRPARLLEPQHPQRLQGDLRAVRERPPRPGRRATSCGASCRRTRMSPTADPSA